MQDNKLYDVGIVGGGLAGLSLAIQCALNGHSVVLFEKEEYPFHKVCGEYISLESWDFLKSLGVKLEELDLPIIRTLELSDANGNAYTFNLPLGGFGISRFFLDELLLNIAIAKGVAVYTGQKVDNIEYKEGSFVISTGDLSVNAKVAVASYGKRSNLDIKWKRSFTLQKPNPLNNYIALKYHVRYSHPSDHIYLHNFYNGYCGLSKIENDKSCLCYLTTADNLRKAGSIEELQKQLLCKNPKIKEVFTTAQFLFKQPVSIAQVSFDQKTQLEDHVLLLGDAAGMISPLCGNGMSIAMHSGKLAFRQIDRFLSHKISRSEMEEAYNRNWKNEFSGRLWMGRMVQQFFGGNVSTSLFIKVMHLLPPLSKYVIKSTHGQPF